MSFNYHTVQFFLNSHGVRCLICHGSCIASITTMTDFKKIAATALILILICFLTAVLYIVAAYQYFCAALVSIVAWNIVVKTLEINDFRHRIKSSSISGPRYIAALVATRLGLRDALVDWSILYSIGYAIVAGFTWKDADPNSVLVLWGISVMVGAIMLAVLGLKIPHWLGFYPKGGLHLIDDTSNLAPNAVQYLIDVPTSQEGEVEGEAAKRGSIIAFRYQVRLAVGLHFSKFALLLLPFYVALKAWQFLVSVAIGCVFGYAYLYVVFKSRQRFRRHRGRVALVASAYMSVFSALMFMEGMSIANESWNLNFADNDNALMIVSFFGWFGLCLLLQAVSYYQNYRFKDNQPRQSTIERLSQIQPKERVTLFDDPVMMSEPPDLHLTTLAEGDEEDEDVEGVLGKGTGLEEPLVGRRDYYKKSSMDESDMSYFYQTGYFDPVSVSMKNELAQSAGRGSVTGTSRQNYDLAVAKERNGEPPKWYSTVWLALPFQPLWDIFLLGCLETFACCRKESDFKERTCLLKFFSIFSRILGILLNLLAVYVALVACIATLQITNTKAKLPYVHEKLYEHINEGPVCAFDVKDGNIKTFGSKEEAHLANYQIAHCGPCGNCSNWIDLELQWSTRKTLAKNSQQCGIKTLGKDVTALQKCLESPMIGGDHGFTSQCALCWAEDIFCTKKFCVFIYLQTRMTNQVGNFKVGPNDITSATCEEANCEAGNPGHFVPCVGANRRRMNITSDIVRPGTQQCSIVDVESWDKFFPPQN